MNLGLAPTARLCEGRAVSSTSANTLAPNKVKLGLFGLSVALFVVSLTLDAYYVEGSNPKAWSASYGLLLVGWIGVLTGIFAWLANPLLALAWALFLLKLDQLSAIASVLAAVTAASFLRETSIMVSEAPTYAKITGHGPGYWLWLSSMLVMIAGACWPPMRMRKR